MKKNKLIVIILYIAIVAAILWMVLGIFDIGKSNLTESQMMELFNEEQVQSFVVKDHTITLYLKNPYQGNTRLTTELADVDAFRQEMSDLLKEQIASGALGAMISGRKASGLLLNWSFHC